MVEALYTQFQEDLLRFCVSLTGARSAAEDLVQEAFLRALTHLEDLERDPLPELEQVIGLARAYRRMGPSGQTG